VICVHFIIYGAGAIGSTVGGHLFRKGYNVTLVANPQHVDKIRESGLKLVTPDKTFVLDIPAYKEAKEIAPFKHDDVVLLTAKSQQTLKCLGQIKNAGAQKSLPIVCVQNSICNESLATRVFDRIYGGLLQVPGIFLEAGTVINPIINNAGFIEIGVYPYGTDNLTHTIAVALKDAGFAGGENERVMKAKGAKCLANLGNAMGAITDGRGESKEFMMETRKEAIVVWRSAGIEWEDFESYNKRVRINRGINKMPRGYENQRNLGSSWQSLMRGTGNIETEALNGDVVKLGRLLGIPTPFNEILWHIADEMASNKEKPGKYTAEELMEMVKTKSNDV
jgi:2-dehydropantoate 2-reductase